MTDIVSQQARVLLIQVRDADDPMREQEIGCFARCLNLSSSQLQVFDLTAGRPLTSAVSQTDLALIGGSGNYSVATGGPWWRTASDSLIELCESRVPVFGSCWGFQALARAMGGVVVTDHSRAQVGTVQVQLTEQATDDPVFAGCPDPLAVQAGHQDIVDRLPENAVCLAGNSLVAHQAFRLTDRPVYGTQFHPELDRAGLLERIHAYPQYVENIAGISLQQFVSHCRETPDSAAVLQRFASTFAG